MDCSNGKPSTNRIKNFSCNEAKQTLKGVEIRARALDAGMTVEDASIHHEQLTGDVTRFRFIATWSRQATVAENIRVNAAMVRNVLAAICRAKSVEHVALVTGLRHYLGPFGAYGKGSLSQTPFREEQSRLDVENFYYAQEDELFAAAEKDGFTWSVHRPHTVPGVAVGNAMNMATTLAVYASICKSTNRPFVFPGSRVQWDSLTDMTDARQLAKQQTVGGHYACCG